MANLRGNNNIVYGLNSPLATLPAPSFIAKKPPTSSDVAEPGTVWIYVQPGQQPQIYIYSTDGWAQLSIDGGSAEFDSLAVNNGTTTLKGSLFVEDADDDVSETIFNSWGFRVQNATTVHINGQNITIGGVSPVTIGGSIITNPKTTKQINDVFPTTVTVGTTVLINGSGTATNVIANISITIDSATSGVINIGVSHLSPPIVYPVIAPFTTATPTVMNFAISIPYSRYLLITTTGTISISNITMFYSGM